VEFPQRCPGSSLADQLSGSEVATPAPARRRQGRRGGNHPLHSRAGQSIRGNHLLHYLGSRLPLYVILSSMTMPGMTRGRELGSELDREMRAGICRAQILDRRAPVEIVRVVAGGRPVMDIAREAVAATGWAGRHSPRTA
jgi:hypothetical protein